MSDIKIVATDVKAMLAKINASIEAVANAERITKAKLSELSRDLLAYISIQQTDDIATVNRLIAVLTPMNKRVSVLFFDHFLPFRFDNNSGQFVEKIKGKRKIDAKFSDVKDFLADENNTIWTWAADNVKVEKAPKPFAEMITSNVKRALEGNDKQEAIDASEILKAVIAGGVSADDVYAQIEALTKSEEAA